MKVHYDREVDALYIELSNQKPDGVVEISEGVNIDTISGIGYCAEHNAIGNMVTEGEFIIKTIVATWKDEKGNVYILHPCGRCRELMRQMNEKNMEADVILGKDRAVKLKELLPYNDDYSKIKK